MFYLYLGIKISSYEMSEINCTHTTDSANKDNDQDALIYILVVISIYVFSLAFFFIK